MAPEIRVGMSGWTYPPWRGKFYPKGLSQKKELEYASRKLTSIDRLEKFFTNLLTGDRVVTKMRGNRQDLVIKSKVPVKPLKKLTEVAVGN